jgi:hypothetical protein
MRGPGIDQRGPVRPRRAASCWPLEVAAGSGSGGRRATAGHQGHEILVDAAAGRVGCRCGGRRRSGLGGRRRGQVVQRPLQDEQAAFGALRFILRYLEAKRVALGIGPIDPGHRRCAGEHLRDPVDAGDHGVPSPCGLISA